MAGESVSRADKQTDVPGETVLSLGRVGVIAGTKSHRCARAPKSRAKCDNRLFISIDNYNVRTIVPVNASDTKMTIYLNRIYLV